MLKRITAALVLAAAFGLAQGQPPAGTTPPQPPDPATMVAMRVAMLAAQLSLTDAQKTSATQIFTNATTASQAVRTTLDTTRQSLNDAVKANNTSSIDSLSATLGTLSGQLTAIDSKAEAAFYAILTSDQQTKYASSPGPGHGPGGGFGPRGAGPAFR